ncbi:MAG: depupylase/deamidase Dop [Actinomycetota bacterium]|nr:depupylase/deamidase Dop [Acidimicrobiales bacterium]MEC9316249.1 depupylase/deamidase Dop [Actinomycetota bacterium]MEE3187586.1 depupylase/deamidase Dop [Actinomycetota bacterium]
MAVHKVLGVETEFGILHRNEGDSNPVAASSMIINAYVNGYLERRVGWDFEDEHPGVDARGFNEFDALAPEIETHLVNAVLTNGARYYVDHAHPELSTPECTDALQCAIYDRAAEEILIRSMDKANQLLPDGEELVIHKNNSDGKGNSYGCHENYLLDRNVPFGRIVLQIMPFFISRQIYCGAGKVGSEAPGVSHDEVPFQITQRADFFEEEVGLETTLKRPIVNTRDEPHADSKRYRRLHVIVGDANMSELQTYLKLGTTAIVLAMIDDDMAPNDCAFEFPVRALREVSYDIDLGLSHRLANGDKATALEVQWVYYAAAERWADRHGFDVVGGEEIGVDVMKRWASVLTALEQHPESLADSIDWIAKRRLYEGFRSRHGIEWDDPKMAALDLQYHDLRPSKGLARRMGLTRVSDDAQVEMAINQPPPTTRAFFRGRCLEKYPDQIVAANWDSMVFDVGSDPLRRVPMLEPLRGTAAHVASLLDECDDAGELLRRLGT